MKWYVFGDMKSEAREAVVFSEEEADKAEKDYSAWHSLGEFGSEEEAQEFCDKYNDYVGEPDVKCACCENGCTMTAYEYGHWNGLCAYR